MRAGKQFFSALSLLLVVFATQASPEQEDTFYQIELIIFANTSSKVATEEYWPSQITLSYPDNLVALPIRTQESDQEVPEVLQEESALNTFAQKIEHPPFLFLVDALKRLKRSSRYRVLFAESWAQPLNYKASHPFIQIAGGEAINGHTELAGAIQLYVERFLHINTQVWLVDYVDGIDDVIPVDPAMVDEDTLTWLWPIPPQSPLDHLSVDPESDALLPTSDIPVSFLNDVLFQDTSDDTAYTLDIKQIGVINNRTRLKSRDIHYIDHPLFGLLIKVTPYKKVQEK